MSDTYRIDRGALKSHGIRKNGSLMPAIQIVDELNAAQGDGGLGLARAAARGLIDAFHADGWQCSGCGARFSPQYAKDIINICDECGGVLCKPLNY